VSREWAAGGKPIRHEPANKTRSCEQKSREARVELCRMPPLTGGSMFVLDKGAAVRRHQKKVVPRELT
jgi:hypothetical protein